MRKIKSTIKGQGSRAFLPGAVIRLIIGFVFVVSQLLAIQVHSASAITYCGTIGALVGVGASCKSSCSGSEVNVTVFRYMVPDQYLSKFDSLCDTGSVCCAARGDALCSKVSDQLSLQGTCASACPSGQQTLSAKISNVPELCSSGSCCVPGSQGTEVKSLTDSNNSGANSLLQTTKGIPASSQKKEIASPGYNLINPMGSRSVNSLAADFIKMLSGFAGTLFMLYILWGGLEWMTAQGDPKKLKLAQNRILYSIGGVIIIFLAYFIVDLLIGFTNIPF